MVLWHCRSRSRDHFLNSLMVEHCTGIQRGHKFKSLSSPGISGFPYYFIVVTLITALIYVVPLQVKMNSSVKNVHL